MPQLLTTAEHKADDARKLPNFEMFSLIGVRDQVGLLLGMIGREGIFSSYTIHDIRHIDAMLKMLDWLIPSSTQAAMVAAEWLLVVLSIYLHDLGMLVTSDEFLHREENEEFRKWCSSLSLTSDGREYLARTDRMDHEEKERFFFQEFVRKGHGQRIKEWISGRHSRIWGPHVAPIAERIADLLSPLPVRFKDHLGIVCESHHLADLDNISKYPLLARFGNEREETANVQYGAILLRTADLLHVTKDRTPSAMYELIRFSDPKSVTEWDKQLGTFAVGPKGRELDESDPKSAVVVLSADFTEERPLFALQEYIAYADAEVKQCNRWVEKSSAASDGRGYKYPWHEVLGDVRLEGVPPYPLRFELDRGRLLDLLVGHTIYNDPTVAIRELLQNGIDAVRYQRYLDAKLAAASGACAPPIGTVTVRWQPGQRVLTVEDSGIGMDRDVIRHHLMSVGSSFYNTPQFETENRDFAPISRFGIGILTCFMISDDIEIVTFQGTKGHRIRMTSVQSTYLLRELDPDDGLLAGLEPHGTRVKVRLRATIDLSERSIGDIVRYWIILPECEVQYVEENANPVSVGFPSVAEALKSFEQSRGPGSPSSAEQEVLVAHCEHPEESEDSKGKAIYQMAFAVRPSTWVPEKLFVTRSQRRTARPAVSPPMVCIEGIRVSDSLPGFDGNDQLSALLSVRGSRTFRTTVSRSGLELDEKYNQVARLCAKMLFEHLHNEVERLSNKTGKPLSLASSAARWLAEQLNYATNIRWTREVIAGLLDRQPSIVMETVTETEPGRPVTNRQLISRETLRQIPSCWTVESRSVDSLGIISRDLGREVSLNDFLVALAPEIKQLRYSPILTGFDHPAWPTSII